MTEVRVPTLGESVTEATVATWFKKVGDPVRVDEMLCELETDKVTVEVPSPISGILKEINSVEGSTVGIATLLAEIKEGNNSGLEKTEMEPNKNFHEEQLSENFLKRGENNGHAPSAIKLMTENNLSPKEIKGTGRDGRIMKEDVKNILETAPLEKDKIISKEKASLISISGLEERVRMTRLRKTIAERLKTSQNTAATLTTYNEVAVSYTHLTLPTKA